MFCQPDATRWQYEHCFFHASRGQSHAIPGWKQEPSRILHHGPLRTLAVFLTYCLPFNRYLPQRHVSAFQAPSPRAPCGMPSRRAWGSKASRPSPPWTTPAALRRSWPTSSLQWTSRRPQRRPPSGLRSPCLTGSPLLTENTHTA